jgi:hypothetical protein
MFRISTLTTSFLFLAACAAGSSPTPPPGPPGSPGAPSNPGAPSGGRSVTPTEQTAVSLGMSILATDAAGAPRLLRSFRPRPGGAGMTPEAAALDHVAALAPLWVNQAQPMALTATGTQQLRNGATVVKLAQQINGVLVEDGELRVLMQPDGALAAVSGTLRPAIAAPAFVSAPRDMLDRALDHRFGAARARPAVAERAVSDGWQTLEVAADPALRITEARTRRLLASDAGQPTPAWELEVFGDAPPEPLSDPTIPNPLAERYVISDATGKVLSSNSLAQNDAFVYRVYAETTGNRRPLDGPLPDFSPHPTGFPDGSAPVGTVPSNLVVMEAFNSPVDPWLATTATVTTGNNVDAFSDLDGSGTFTTGDVRPEVRAGRVVNHPYDTNLEALASAEQFKAGAVNNFFLANWMHDWWYESGFTEATGNAQLDNLGRGGVAGDPMIVLAQAGALVGSRDNASMSTPADGRSPRMRIFVFTTSTVASITTPAGAIRSEGFSAAPHTFDLTGAVAIVDDGVAPGNDGCQPITTDLRGKIALITFSGVCGSAATVDNARAAGAIGVILADGALDDPRAFAGSVAANIPGLAIGMTDGAALAAAVAAGPLTVTLDAAPFGVERDGDLDSGVSGHEWAHYLHHRLTVCNRGQQCGGMSEGWGDFNGLLLQLREGDNRDSTYAQGSYADADGTPNAAYFSVRRFPYSRDRTKNDLSFRHIGDDAPLPTTTPSRLNGGANSEVHNTGEVWTSLLFEAYNLLIDQHGVPVARRRISDYVVAGLLMTPPEATFTEGRDAILAAASALDTDDMLLIAAGFAGRGAGSCAVAPTNAVLNNAGVIESGTLAGVLTIGGVTLSDGAASDHDGRLEPGESGTLHLTLANGGVVAAENVVITATTTATGVRIGAPIHLALVSPFSGTDVAIPVSLAQTAPATPIAFSIHVDAEDTCDRNGITVSVTPPPGAPGLSADDADDADDSALATGGVMATYQAPSMSLAAADAAVCITGDTP